MSQLSLSQKNELYQFTSEIMKTHCGNKKIQKELNYYDNWANFFGVSFCLSILGGGLGLFIKILSIIVEGWNGFGGLSYFCLGSLLTTLASGALLGFALGIKDKIKHSQDEGLFSIYSNLEKLTTLFKGLQSVPKTQNFQLEECFKKLYHKIKEKNSTGFSEALLPYLQMYLDGYNEIHKDDLLKADLARYNLSFGTTSSSNSEAQEAPEQPTDNFDTVLEKLEGEPTPQLELSTTSSHNLSERISHSVGKHFTASV